MDHFKTLAAVVLLKNSKSYELVRYVIKIGSQKHRQVIKFISEEPSSK